MKVERNEFRRIIREYVTSEENSKLMGEGLIKTHHPNYVLNLLNTWFNKEIKAINDIPIEGSIGSIIVYLKSKLTDEKYDNLLKLMNNMGYYVASYFDNNGTFGKVKDELDNVYGIRFEPKFDIEYRPNQRYMYHLTDKKHLDKILKIGLTPKTKSKMLYHPDRIYLTKTIEGLNNIKTVFDINYSGEYVVLKIDLRDLFIFLRQDGQFKEGVYTTDNIPPNHIEIEENKK